MYKFIETWDLWHYYLNADKFVKTGVIDNEYPKLAIIPMIIPRYLTDNFGTYLLIYYALMLLCVFGTSYAIQKAGKSPWLYVLIVTLLFPLSFGIYDIFVSFFFMLSVFLAQKNKIPGSLNYLFAIALKLYPLVVLPILAWRALRKKSYGWYVLAGIIGAIIIFSDSNFLATHKDRTVQPEALYTNIVYLQGLRPEVIYANNAMALADVHAPLYFTIPLLALGVLRGLWTRLIYQAMFYPILGFILANGVFSPQYLIWIAPFVPFIKKKSQLLVVGAAILTTLYLGFYGQAVHFENPYYMMIFTRNLLLLLALFI